VGSAARLEIATGRIVNPREAAVASRMVVERLAVAPGASVGFRAF